MNEFGTLDDWKEMISEMHKRGIKLIMDFVANHTSIEHEWFIQARSSRQNPYHDYYICATKCRMIGQSDVRQECVGL